MSETCARCGTDYAPYGISPPFEWLDYLREERGLAPPIGTITIPLCNDCDVEFGATKETWQHLGSPPIDRESDIAAKVRDRLDDLDLDRIDDDLR